MELVANERGGWCRPTPSRTGKSGRRGGERSLRKDRMGKVGFNERENTATGNLGVGKSAERNLGKGRGTQEWQKRR